MSPLVALVVEDSHDLGDIFAEALGSVGYRAIVERDGQAAIERLATVTPHIVVLDMHLPRVMGDQVLAHIRSEPRLAETRVIIITADPVRAAGGADEQADLVLSKPITFTQLRELAQRLRPADSSLP